MSDTLDRLFATIVARRTADPAASYVAKVTAKGRAKIAQKLGEEAVETVIAAMQGDAAAITSEAADLLFHLLILLADAGLTPDDVLDELARRENVSGLAEKAGRRPPSPSGEGPGVGKSPRASVLFPPHPPAPSPEGEGEKE